MESKSNPNPSNSILLVEDDKATLELLATIISLKYPEVVLHRAFNGRKGLELFKEHKPDIVITDMNMPEMNGVHLADKIRVSEPDTKIILLTANTGKVTLEHADGESFEIDHYILKPVKFGILFAAIDQCLGEPAQQG